MTAIAYPFIQRDLLQWTTGITLELGAGDCQYQGSVNGRHVGLDLPECPYPNSALRLSVFGDAMQLPFQDESVSGAFAVAMLYLTVEPETVLAEVSRVLAPGGQVVLYDYTPRVLKRLGVPVRRTRRQWATCLEKAGLTDVEDCSRRPFETARLGLPVRMRWLVARALSRDTWLILKAEKPMSSSRTKHIGA